MSDAANKQSSDVDTDMHTEKKWISHVIRWTVTGLALNLAVNDFTTLESGIFPTFAGQFAFQLKVNGQVNQRPNNREVKVSLYFVEATPAQPDTDVITQILVYDADGKCIRQMNEAKTIITSTHKNTEIRTFTCPYDSTLFNSFKKITVRVEMNSCAGVTSTFALAPILSETHAHELQLVDDMKKLATDEKLTDCTIVVGKREFKAFRALLCVRSPVFRRMLNSGLSESRENRIVISDFDAAVVEQMLAYIHTGNIGVPFTNIPVGLLTAADKYDIAGLKRLVEEQLNTTLTVGNVCEWLQRADTHDAKAMRLVCLTFIVKHRKEVMKQASWKVFCANDTKELIADLLQMFDL